MCDYRDMWLSELLDCGYCDVSILEDIEYDITDLAEYCKINFGEVNLGGIVISAFSFGLSDIYKSIERRIQELDAEDVLTDEQKEEVEALKVLDPHGDADWYFNFLDTSIWFHKNKELYEKHCQEECDEFYEKTGYEILG